MDTKRFSENGPPFVAAARLGKDYSSFALMSIPALLILAAASLFIAGCGDEDISSPGEGHIDGLYPPELVIREPFLGMGKFRSRPMFPATAKVLAGIEFSFSWQGVSLNDPLDHYTYRYGWDIKDPSEDAGWAVPWNPYSKHSEPRSFQPGTHVFWAEVKNLSGEIARARVSLEVIPYRAGRDLLWIDDYLLGAYVVNMTEPSEAAHDEFWTDICSAAPGFDPAVDVFPADEQSRGAPVPLEVLAGYRNVVWTYGSHAFTSWRNTIVFSPRMSQTSFPRPNNLKMFLAAGGNILSCGRSDRTTGGLSAVFPMELEYPAEVTDFLPPLEFNPGYPTVTVASEEYHVTAVDKVLGDFRTDMQVVRDVDWDAMRMALRT